jgi:hypothetical protein
MAAYFYDIYYYNGSVCSASDINTVFVQLSYGKNERTPSIFIVLILSYFMIVNSFSNFVCFCQLYHSKYKKVNNYLLKCFFVASKQFFLRLWSYVD